MLRLISIELYKVFTKPRSYLGFVAVFTIVALIEFALYLNGEEYIEFIFRPLMDSFQISGKILSGSLVCFIILQMLIVQMPLLVCLVTGDLVSGEVAAGTMRLVGTKPISRAKLLWAKYFAGSAYTLALIVWLGVLALGGGMLIFGEGDLPVLKSDGIVILREGIMLRFIGALLVAFLSLSVVATFSLMLSCFTDNSITPIVASMSVIIIFTIIGTLEVPLFDLFKPFMFTTHMIIWRDLFYDPIEWNTVFTSIGILVLHIVGFLSVAFYHFTKKDLLN